jgi:hypothetical protein
MTNYNREHGAKVKLRKDPIKIVNKSEKKYTLAIGKTKMDLTMDDIARLYASLETFLHWSNVDLDKYISQVKVIGGKGIELV